MAAAAMLSGLQGGPKASRGSFLLSVRPSGSLASEPNWTRTWAEGPGAACSPSAHQTTFQTLKQHELNSSLAPALQVCCPVSASPPSCHMPGPHVSHYIALDCAALRIGMPQRRAARSCAKVLLSLTAG